MSCRNRNPLTLKEHAELAVELNRMRELLKSWRDGDVGGKLGYRHAVVKKMERTVTLLDQLRCELDTVWCCDTPRDSGLPYYDPMARKALAEQANYRTDGAGIQ